MAKNVDGLVDSKIDARLKRIMEQRNIHNEAVVTSSDAEDENIYVEAANSIVDYISSTGFVPELSDDVLKDYYEYFAERFAPEKISVLSGLELLKTIFYSSDSTNDSLCYNLEFQQQIREGCGSIAGGSSYKFGLFQRKEDQQWISGSPNSPIELSDEEAIQKGKEIVDVLIKGTEIISKSDLTTIEAYEKLDDELNLKIGKYASIAWVHKYFHMLFPDKFAIWHSPEWQKHILFAYGIMPNEKYYARSGQLAKIARLASLSMNVFAHASYDWFGGIKQFCRLGTSDEEGNYFSDWVISGVASIGWNAVESIETYKTGSEVNKKALAERLLTYYYATDAKLASRKAGELITYYNTGKETVFVAMDGERLLGLGDNLGGYYYDSDKHMAHCKSTDWHCCFNEDEKLPVKSEGVLTSCVTLNKADNLIYLYRKYYHELVNLEIESKDHEGEIMEYIEREARTDKTHSLNQIIYGAPGTGKTYSSVEYAVAIIEKRPINESQLSVEQRKALMDKYSSLVRTGQIVFTTFHQSYGYEEFIQGLRPSPNKGNITFKKTDGVFKTIADKALKDKENNYVIIIDEINRGNISKIFGELITLIEEDKRWGELNQMEVTLPMGGRFTVPNNLYIIGTMNSADKSISLIDAALRRRFEFIEMAPNHTIIEDNELRDNLKNLNDYLRKELRSTDLLVGHSYFMGRDSNELPVILNRSIIPLLYEYFYDDEAKVKKAIECIGSNKITLDDNALGRIKVKRRDDNG